MKKHMGIWITLGIIAVLAIYLISSYNGLVNIKAETEAAFANIDTQLQRRSDLIPNFLETVKGAAAHEKEVIDSVTTARTKYSGASTVNEKVEASNELSGALSRLMMVVENYPDIKANQNYIALQDELAGTENRIAISRKDYNEAVKNYNAKIKTFPRNILANMFGFDDMKYFEVEEGAKEVPKVKF